MFRVPVKVIQKALRIAARHTDDWPEDEWYAVGRYYDLNLSSGAYDGVKMCHGCIYRIDGHGNTMTDDWVRVIEFVPHEGQYVPEDQRYPRVGV